MLLDSQKMIEKQIIDDSLCAIFIRRIRVYNKIHFVGDGTSNHLIVAAIPGWRLNEGSILDSVAHYLHEIPIEASLKVGHSSSNLVFPMPESPTKSGILNWIRLVEFRATLSVCIHP